MAALVLGLGLLTACSSNDVPDDGGKVATGSTYMSVAINLATTGGAGSRADKQADTENSENPDYNNVGKWAGQDKIESIDVYVFKKADGAFEAHQNFTASQFTVQAPAGDKSVTVTPSKGIKVDPGQKVVYVVVNPTTITQNFLPKTTVTEFKDKYENIAGTTGNFIELPSVGGAGVTVKTSAGELAKVEGDKDVITMTVIKAAEVNVEENVSEPTTLQDAKNRAALTVKRAVARVMVTTTQNEFEVKGDDPLTPGVKEDIVLGTVSNIRYVVAQGEKSLYFMQNVTTDADLTYKTPFSAYIPTKNPNDDFIPNYNWADVNKQYDYSGLWKEYNAAGIGGIVVPTASLFKQADAAGTLAAITADLKAGLKGEFILPNTHKYGATQDLSGYRKGNTAYVLVRAQFNPKKVVMNDGSISQTYPAGKTFYMGANGVFYESVDAARDASAGKHGVAGQTAAKYENGKTLYFAWINPDKAKGWINSPVNRNNIYHIEISGFKRIGANWNPLVPPVDPNKPNDPNPNNPDPKPKDDKPNDPNEPNDPPVKPDDPLTPKETWMSVQTTILPWNVHSYSVVLDI